LGARWTVDTAEDHVFVAAVLERVTRRRAGAAASACGSAATSGAAPLPSAAVLDALAFPSTDVAEVVAAEPELAAINAGRGGAGVAPGAVFECPRGQALHARAVAAMPGTPRLAHQWPAYYTKTVGCHVSDLDGHRFVDTLCSTCVLGMGDTDVNSAVIAAVERGNASTLNSPDEVALAEKLVALHASWASGVKFARTGSEAVALAIGTARAHTKRDVVAVCGWHARYSSVSETAVTFAYNDAHALVTLGAVHGQRLAAIVVEPTCSRRPRDGFLAAARKVADSTGAVLIFDEVSTGFRMCVGGAHTVLAEGPLDGAAAGSAGYIEPDIAVFAEGMSNGFAMAAVVCRASVAGVGAEDNACFADATGFAAALATIEKFERCYVHKHIAAVGERICLAWAAASYAARLPIYVTSDACALPRFAWRGWSNSDAIVMTEPVVQALTALFIKSMLTKGFIAANVWHVTYAHTFAVVDDYKTAVTDVFKTVIAPALADALAAGENEDAAVAAIIKHLRGTNAQDVHSSQT
jgi:glutamate-1-semialdehyde 2,1-aminomutase